MKFATKAMLSVGCLLLIVGVAACGGGSSSSSSSSGESTEASSENTEAGSETSNSGSGGSEVSKATIQTALKFTGGKEGPADQSLPPVKIGYVNQEGTTPSFTEYGEVTTASVNFVNEHLGGIDGHPIELVKCVLQSEEDGQKCAGELRNSGEISVAILGLAVVGNQSFYNTVDGEFPVLVDVSATGPDSTTEDVFSLDGGGGAVLNAQAEAVNALNAKEVALLTANNPAGKQTALTTQKPRMEELGIKPTVVLFEDTASAPEFATAISNSSAANAGAIAFNPSSNAQCNLLYDGLKQLGVSTPVVTNVFCAADEVVSHVGEGLNGWEFSSFGWNPRVPGNPQAEAYANVMEAEGKSELVNAGYTFKAFADVLAVDQLAQSVGVENLSGETMEKAIREWPGPAYMIPGEMKCGWNPETVSVCGNSAENSTFENGQWKDLGPVELPK
jgi:branched-chain amino acid transport system substrate-binding protein